MTCIMDPYLLIICAAFCAIPLSVQHSNALAPLPANGFQFTGTWSCQGAFRNNKVHRSIYTGAVILDGKWLELTERDTEPASGYVAKYLIGYDPQQKRLVEFDANSFGAGVYSSQAGWQNAILILTSQVARDARTPYSANRFVYSVTGRDSFTVEWQISQTPNGSWVTADHLSCKQTAMP
jgi:hypothetical protein